MPAPVKTATPALATPVVVTPALAQQLPQPTEPPKRIKGLHYHTLILNQPSLPPSLSVHTQFCEIDEEYNIKSSSSSLPSVSASISTLLNHYSLDYRTLDLPWKQEEVVLVFSFQAEESVVGWSWALYSDKRLELDVFKPPVPSFSQLVQVCYLWLIASCSQLGFFHR